MKAHFKTDLEATISGYFNGNKFIRTVTLLEDLVFYTKAGDSITVPKGFESDGASVPKVFWSAFPPFGKYLKAAIVHDWFCVTHQVDSITAAKVFREAMQVCGVPRWKCRCMYLAVRITGPKFQKIDKS